MFHINNLQQLYVSSNMFILTSMLQRGDFGPDGTFRWTDDGPINPRRDRNKAMKDWRKTGMYSKSVHSEPLEKKDDEDEVWNLIHDRLEARRVKDFDLADLIRDHLYKQYRVSVDDQLRQWSVGGEFDVEATQSLRSGSPTTTDGKTGSSFMKVYNQRGGNGQLSEKEVLLVKAMIKRRAEEFARYNLQAAESIRKGLKKKFYVIIDDVNCEWHVRGNDFIMSPTLKSIPQAVENSKMEIESLIRERNQAKGEGDYQRADEIRSDLFSTYSIVLDDRLKEWSIKSQENKQDSGDESKHDNLSSLTVAQLKDKLKSAGLAVSGRKAELIERLLQQG
jgi:cysteinyl-tRNA synthetase